ncbi:transposase [Puniceicoccaceae bacterium K14]|nr:transposase [Puniceicoccaceae bacterium K14]
MIDILNPFGNRSSYCLCIGIDWGHSKNSIHMIASQSDRIEHCAVDADPASMRSFIDSLRKRFPEGKMLVASEQSKGALTNLLLDFDFVVPMAVNPHSAAKFRRSLHPSGSKSDPIDSSALLRMLFTHKDRMAQAKRLDDQSQRLDVIGRHRRLIVEQRVEVALRLRSLLREYYPQCLPMLGPEIWNPISLAFLKKWPCYSKLLKAKQDTLRRFYYANGSRSKCSVEKRLSELGKSDVLSSDPLLEELGELRMRSFVEQISMLEKQIRQIEKTLQSCFRDHPDKEIFASLAGAGPAMAPRLAAAFGTDRGRYASCEQLQAYVGIAPIQVQSGNCNYTFMRRFCPKFLRQSFHEWAGLSIQHSAWAKACYEMLRERGKRVGEAKRALAFKWIRILYKCWISKTPYDETKHLENLRKTNSPVIAKMQEMNLIKNENILFYT